MHVYVHIITWNERKYLPDLLESLRLQTYQDFSIRLLDNGSTDGTVEYIRQFMPTSLIAHNKKNLGFAEGHNQLIRFTLGHAHEDEDCAILLINADMLLEPNAIEVLVRSCKKGVGAVQPKVYRAFGENLGDEYLEETVKSDVIDTTGLSVSKSWRMFDRGAGDLDKGQYDSASDLFGPSGAIALFPIKTVIDLMEGNDFFDSDFFTYREDCDLAWRLQKRGWKTVFEPKAIGYHYRGMFGAQKQSWFGRLRNRQGQSPFFAAYSTRNQIFVLLKNLTIGDFILSFPHIIIDEGGRLIYTFIFEGQTRRRILEIWKFIPKMLKKRKAIKKRQLKSEREIRKYVGLQ
ncbi:glycosyltransferase family 2 protein [Patescibacteria group bacterium]|nr:glycosyltransferase family 2 protein [Patescibacteria group bacterium]MBU4453299.1 glycosyltransferase family 2 protein [Patescibacteria group bacterium]MCG2687868.1 glycosyltransferase family 2 protein [Candidatus Parcubacteria bacterium]